MSANLLLSPPHDALLGAFDLSRGRGLSRSGMVVPGAGFFCRREVALRIPFNPTLGHKDGNRLRGYEMRDWSNRVREAGYRILYDPDAVIYHRAKGLVEWVLERFHLSSRP